MSPVATKHLERWEKESEKDREQNTNGKHEINMVKSGRKRQRRDEDFLFAVPLISSWKKESVIPRFISINYQTSH